MLAGHWSYYLALPQFGKIWKYACNLVPVHYDVDNWLSSSGTYAVQVNSSGEGRTWIISSSSVLKWQQGNQNFRFWKKRDNVPPASEWNRCNCEICVWLCKRLCRGISVEWSSRSSLGVALAWVRAFLAQAAVVWKSKSKEGLGLE